jgi:WXG100 family type VII secretion target
MPASRVKINFEKMNNIAHTFEHQAEAVRIEIGNLKQKLGVLQAGDWRGGAADKFYQEMEATVLPCLQRVANALDASASLTTKIGALMKQAEVEAAALFNLRYKVGFLGIGSGAWVGSGVGSPKPGSTGGPAYKADLFSKLPPEVEKIAKQSPTLMTQLQKLQKDKWQIVVSDRPTGNLNEHPTDSQGNLTIPDTKNGADTFADAKIIRIYKDSNHKPENYVDEIAHEVGHAVDNPKFSRPDAAGMTQAKYVHDNVNRALTSEAEAAYNELTVRDEILKDKGPDIGMSGISRGYEIDDYEGTFKNLTHAQAIPKIREVYDQAQQETKEYTDHFNDNWKLYNNGKGKVNTWN